LAHKKVISTHSSSQKNAYPRLTHGVSVSLSTSQFTTTRSKVTATMLWIWRGQRLMMRYRSWIRLKGTGKRLTWSCSWFETMWRSGRRRSWRKTQSETRNNAERI